MDFKSIKVEVLSLEPTYYNPRAIKLITQPFGSNKNAKLEYILMFYFISFNFKT